MSIEFGRVKDYGVNLLSRSFGIEYFKIIQEGRKLEDAVGIASAPRFVDNALGAGLSVLVFMGSNTFRAMFTALDLEVAPIQDKPRFKKKLLIPAVVSDIAPLGLMFVNPLFGLTKPLINIAGNLVGDIVDRRLFGGDKLPKASEGVYDLLEKAYRRFYDEASGAGIVRDSEGKVVATITEERVCVIGGSCLDLRVMSTHGNFFEEGTHITRGNRIANTFSFITEEVPPEQDPIQKVDDLLKAASLS